MKNRIKILLGAVIGSSLLLSSCNFLDVDNYFQESGGNCLGRDCRQMADQRVLGSAIQCWYCQRKKPAAGYMV